MKTKTLLLAMLIGALSIACSGEKSKNGDGDKKEQTSSISLSKDINGTWQITNIDGDGGISKDVKFVFSNNELTLDAGYYTDKVKMKDGDGTSFSYTDQNDITWSFDYKVNGNLLILENLFNNKVHATYTLEKE